MLVKIEVTKEDFKDADYYSNCDCPNARAIKRVVKNSVRVSIGCSFFHLNSTRLLLPREAIEINDQPALRAEDGLHKLFVYEECHGFTYDLDIPEEFLKSSLFYKEGELQCI